MQRAVALKKLRKLLGDSVCYRVDADAPDADTRKAASLALPTATAAYEKVKKLRDDRRAAVLVADKEYQDLVLACETAAKEAAKIRGLTYRFKFTVGTSNGIFFHVRAEGDSWEDVIDKIKNKIKKGKTT